MPRNSWGNLLKICCRHRRRLRRSIRRFNTRRSRHLLGGLDFGIQIHDLPLHDHLQYFALPTLQIKVWQESRWIVISINNLGAPFNSVVHVHAFLVGEGIQPTMHALEEAATTLSWPLLRGLGFGRALENKIIEHNFGGVANDVFLIVNDNKIRETFGVMGRSKHCWIHIRCGFFLHL